jgi:hypothetical protein
VITSLRATSRTIADFLQDQFVADPVLRDLFAPPGTLHVYLNTPAEMAARAGLSVWLYRVVRDEMTLNRPPERITATLIRRVPLPVRLHYLVTPMTNSDEDDAPETEHAILGKVLQCFHDHPQLAGTDLSDDFEGTDSVVSVRLETLGVDEMARVWDALESPYRTSISYEVTVVDVDAGVQPEVGPPVRVPRPETGVVVGAGGGP